MNFTSEKSEKSRYIIGIDLGTTNSALAFVDTSRKPFSVEDFPILQISASSENSSLNLFPSFHYEAAEGEFSEGALHLPWDEERDPKRAVGVFARDHGAQIPGRLIFSAKSWLSHSGVDRTAPLLPWHALPDVEKISPLETTARYLNHIRSCWDYDHPENLMADQDVVITVPASFDEVARELTVEAAAQAGLQRIVLLEEPQAAFYAWIQQHSRDWQTFVNPGQKILICDIGGGTTDFTLIQVRPGENNAVQFHRIAVGDHLILGGDNLDLALAYHIEKNHLAGRKLTPRQFGSLVRNCQKAKELLLEKNAPETMTVVIPGTGASLIGGALQVQISKKEIHEILIDGYFPFIDIEDKPSKRQSGFQEFGLPYAPDPAVTKYLAEFLTAHRTSSMQYSNAKESDPARPDIVLFNGGVFTSETIRDRILSVLEKWFSTVTTPWKPVVFENKKPELAVARGAAYFGLVRRGEGVRISAGLARSYYIGVETKGNEMRALCLAPAGLREGQNVDLESRTFNLLIRQPVEFPLYVSSRRTTDTPGELVDIDPLEMYSLPLIRTVLRSGKKMEAGTVKVMLHVKLTEIGTLDLWCTETEGNRSWKLQFDVRSATRTDIEAYSGSGEQEGVIDNETLISCRELINATFCPSSTIAVPPQELIKRIEQTSGIDRNSWPPSLLRYFWEILMEIEEGRGRDPLYEVRWLNFVGFSLRPGYGYAVDDWRVKQTWLLFQKGIIHQRNQACKAEWWILWRRIAGGLASGQQLALAQPLIASLKTISSSNEQKRKSKAKIEVKFGIHELAEIWRLLGSLEYLPARVKAELGDRACGLALHKDVLSEAAIWALGRLGCRIPLYGPLNELVDSEYVSQWAHKLIQLSEANATVFLALMQLCRKTNDRYRDIEPEIRVQVIEFMKKHKASPHFISLIEDGGKLDEEEQSEIFGESLPKGLSLIQ